MCDYPDCTAEAKYLNDGGFWCTHPHNPSTSPAGPNGGAA